MKLWYVIAHSCLNFMSGLKRRWSTGMGNHIPQNGILHMVLLIHASILVNPVVYCVHIWQRGNDI